MPYKNPENWLFWPVLLGIVGGAITYLRDLKKRAGKFSPWEFALNVLAAGFVGLITSYCVKEFGYSQGFAGAMAGVAGLMTRAILDNFWRYATVYMEQRFKIKLTGRDSADS